MQRSPLRRKTLLPTDATTPPFNTPEYDRWEEQQLTRAGRNYSDQAIYELWCKAGSWLLAAKTPELHRAFTTTFANVMAGFAGAPDEAKVPTIENWFEAGERLIQASRARPGTGYRELVFLLAARALLIFDVEDLERMDRERANATP